jgi:hypothetical protein
MPAIACLIGRRIDALLHLHWMVGHVSRDLPQPGLARGHVVRNGRHRERNNQKQDGTRTVHGVFSHANPAFRIGFAGGR